MKIEGKKGKIMHTRKKIQDYKKNNVWLKKEMDCVSCLDSSLTTEK